MSPESLLRGRVPPRLRGMPRAEAVPELPLRAVADLLACLGVAGLAAALALAAPGALGPASWLLAAAVVFVVPGYLLMEAAAPAPPGPSARAARALLALGLSPAVVGLVALSTAAVPGGFRPATIVAALALACAVLGAAALWRRAHPGPRQPRLLEALRRA